MIDVYVAGDSGASGFGVATRGLVRSLLDQDEIQLNFRTHDHGLSRVGVETGRLFPDTRFRERLFREDLVNDAALVEDPREAARRDTNTLLEALNAEVDEELLIKQWDGAPNDADVWIAVGGPGFAAHAPDDPHTILSTDYNLDVIPGDVVDRDTLQALFELFESPLSATTEEYLQDELGVENRKQFEAWLKHATQDDVRSAFDHETESVQDRILALTADCVEPSVWKRNLPQVDEIWVPSEWTRSAIVERFPDLEDNCYALPYGVDQRYEPGLYDHENCPGSQQNVPHSGGPPQEQPCLADDAFTFLVVSRFYHIKGLYRTIWAFMEEFTSDEDVRMFVKTTSNQQFEFSAEGGIQAIRQELEYPNPPEVGVGKAPMDAQHMMDLYGRADCFVQASRGECFGIAQFQAAYARTPVIYTDWSAQRELIDGDVDGFLPLEEYDLERPEPESEAFMFEGPDRYPIDAQWATPDVDALGDRMREVYELNPDERSQWGQSAREFVEEQYQWGDHIIPRLMRIRQAVGQEVPA